MRRLIFLAFILLLMSGPSLVAQDVRYNFDSKADFTTFKLAALFILRQDGGPGFVRIEALHLYKAPEFSTVVTLQIPSTLPALHAQTACSDSAKVASAEASSPIADRSTFERAGRFERIAPCVWPIAPYGRWGCI
jgi:hypothetical protein